MWVVIFSCMYMYQRGLPLEGKGHVASSTVLLIHELWFVVLLLAASMIH